MNPGGNWVSCSEFWFGQSCTYHFEIPFFTHKNAVAGSNPPFVLLDQPTTVWMALFEIEPKILTQVGPCSSHTFGPGCSRALPVVADRSVAGHCFNWPFSFFLLSYFFTHQEADLTSPWSIIFYKIWIFLPYTSNFNAYRKGVGVTLPCPRGATYSDHSLGSIQN